MLNFASHKTCYGWLGAAALISASSFSTHGQYDPDWTRNFRVGLLTGFNIKGDFKMNGAFDISGNRVGQLGVGGQNHLFDDGYVRVDRTGNSGGYTTFWGYERPDQVQSGQLLFQSTSSFEAASKASGDDEAPYLGFELAYGGIIWRGERMRIGWEFGFGLLPITISDDSRFSATVQQNTYAFDLPGGVIPPSAPYNGSASGEQQPLLGDVGTLVDAGDPMQVNVTGSRELEVILYAFRLGPTLYFDLHPAVGLTVGAGPAVGLVTGNYRYNELIAGETRNRGDFDASEFLFGGYINAMLTYHAARNGDFYLGAQYMPLGSAEFSESGRTAKLDLSGGIYISAGINWPF
ncbi:MAG TPA: hypothetical protein VEH04_02900 [Verrucomicrobiae bacterium]|nr:hypothetical protein [Verrucomicrobiae bacterium]